MGLVASSRGNDKDKTMGAVGLSARLLDAAVEFSLDRLGLWLHLRRVVRIWAEIRPHGDSMWEAWTERGEVEIRAGRLAVIVAPRATLLAELAVQPDPDLWAPPPAPPRKGQGTKRARV